MRITYIHQYFNTTQMSGSTRSFEMGRRLVKMGHEVNIITSWRDDTSKKKNFKTIEDGINVYWLSIPYNNYMGFFQRLIAFFKFIFLAYIKAKSIKTDIVFASSTPLTVAIPGIFVARRNNVPFVFEVRDLWPELPIVIGAIKNPIAIKLAYELEKFAYRNSKGIVALSPGMKEGILRTGYPDDKICVIPNSSDLELFNATKINKKFLRLKYNIPEKPIVILYPGTFGKVNGVEYLVKLASKFLNDSRIFFLTVGDGQEFNMVKSKAIELGCLGKNLIMLKKVSKLDVAEIYECADIVISTLIPLPELEANSANKFFDGLAAGSCIALNYRGWQADLLESTGAGFSLSQNIDLAVNQLLSWIDNPNKIYEAGIKARRLAENDFDRNILAKQLEIFLSSIVQRGNKN